MQENLAALVLLVRRDLSDPQVQEETVVKPVQVERKEPQAQWDLPDPADQVGPLEKEDLRVQLGNQERSGLMDPQVTFIFRFQVFTF